MRASQIAKCIREHGMRTRRTIVGTRNSPRLVFERCDWPPLIATSTDGYSEVVATVTDLGKPASAAYSEIDVLKGECENLAVTYVLDHMLGRDFVSGSLRVGRLYVVTTIAKGDSPAVVLRQLNATPLDVAVSLPTQSTERVDVLRSGHVALFDARCIPDTNGPLRTVAGFLLHQSAPVRTSK